jgi:hypothetical protein
MMVCWSGDVLVWWSDGLLIGGMLVQCGGVLEWWYPGVVCWSGDMLVWWYAGMVVCW